MKWEVRQRLTLLEATVLWSGELTTQVLTKAFGISRAQASKDLTQYQEMCPQNLHYDSSQKRYLTTDNFEPAFIKGTPDEYLRLTKLAQTDDLDESDILTQLPAVALMEPAAGRVNFHALQQITRAIRLKQNIQFRYHTMSDKPSHDCTLSPNTLVYNGFRWHVRGYSHEHGEYRDYVLSRIEGPALTAKPKAYQDNNDDREWQAGVTIEICPHPGLNERQQQIIADDYGMENNLKSVRVRGALVQYFLNLMKIGPNDEDLPGSVQQVILRNKKEVAPHLWS